MKKQHSLKLWKLAQLFLRYWGKSYSQFIKIGPPIPEIWRNNIVLGTLGNSINISSPWLKTNIYWSSKWFFLYFFLAFFLAFFCDYVLGTFGNSININSSWLKTNIYWSSKWFFLYFSWLFFLLFYVIMWWVPLEIVSTLIAHG